MIPSGKPRSRRPPPATWRKIDSEPGDKTFGLSRGLSSDHSNRRRFGTTVEHAPIGAPTDFPLKTVAIRSRIPGNQISQEHQIPSGKDSSPRRKFGGVAPHHHRQRRPGPIAQENRKIEFEGGNPQRIRKRALGPDPNIASRRNTGHWPLRVRNLTPVPANRTGTEKPRQTEADMRPR